MTRKRLAIVVSSLLLVLGMTGCSVSAGVFVSKNPSAAPEPSQAQHSSAPQTGAGTRGHRAKHVKLSGEVAVRFHTGLQRFCRDWYLGERHDELKNLFYSYGATPMDGGPYFESRVRTSRRVDRLLAQLRPPPSLAAIFHSFVDNERALFRAQRGQLKVALSPTPADNAFQARDDRRHALAVKLDAGYCDGKLPPRQRRTVIRISRRFDLASNPELACRKLVMPQIMPTEFQDYATCAARLITIRTKTWELPTSIRVHQVTGVDGIQAHIEFYEEGAPCGCANRLVTFTLYDTHGNWRIRYAS